MPEFPRRRKQSPPSGPSRGCPWRTVSPSPSGQGHSSQSCSAVRLDVAPLLVLMLPRAAPPPQVADEDFADAISDEDGEEQEQEEEEIIRRSSMAGLPVPMPASRVDSEAARRSREAGEPGAGSSSSGGEDEARAEDFMALFATQLSDRWGKPPAENHCTAG